MPLTDGEQILKGLREARKFFEQVSLLIQTADDLLAAEGWEVLSSWQCTELLGHVSRPKEWMPTNVYRYYVVDEDSELNKDLALLLGVLLEPEKAWAGFKEPWITWGLLQFSSEKNAREFKDWAWVDVHSESEYPPDGHPYQYKRTSEDRGEEQAELVFYSTMALPLVQIQSAEDLKEKVIKPLLDEIKQVSNRRQP